MATVRIIARLDIKGRKLIKGIHLEGWRFVGDPNEYSKKYYEDGIDEIIYIDAVASLYNREILLDIIEKTTRDVFVPLTTGGGVRTVEDAYQLLRAGADKVAVNTGAVKNPQLITDIATRFGKQCMVLSIQAKKINTEKWMVYIDSGREPTGQDVVEWVREGINRGAGEILVTSIDQEGTQQGFDIDLLRAVTDAVSVPVIASGGFGKPQDFVDAITKASVDAVAIADAFHFNRLSVSELRSYLQAHEIMVRQR